MPLQQVPIKYGWVRGGKVSIPLQMGASEVINNRSGKFITLDANKLGEISGAGDVIFGFVEAPAETTLSAEGGTIYNCIIDPTAVFRVAINVGTLVTDGLQGAANSVLGESCGLTIVSDVQGVDLDTGADNFVFIVGGDIINNNYIDVMINYATVTKTALT